MATDDIVLTSKHAGDIERVKSEIQKHWDITDGGEMHWYLGFQIRRDCIAHTISINQCAYIEAMLEKFRLTNAKPVSIPMASSEQFTKDQGPSTLKQVVAMRGVSYAEVIGCVLWPVMIT